jgi:hypothetical protein
MENRMPKVYALFRRVPLAAEVAGAAQIATAPIATAPMALPRLSDIDGRADRENVE